MMGHDEQVDRAQAIGRAHQIELLVPCEIAHVHHFEASERDVRAH
jgi:hypothetical protein